MRVGGFDKFRLGCRPFGSDLGKARRKQDSCRAATLGQCGDRLQCCGRRHNHDRHVGCFRKCRDAGVRGETLHRRTVWVHWENLACVALTAHVRNRPTPDAGRIVRGPNDRDRIRVKQFGDTGTIARACAGGRGAWGGSVIFSGAHVWLVCCYGFVVVFAVVFPILQLH